MKRIICLFLLLTTLIFPNSSEDLFNAIKKLDISGVKTAIEKNANVNAKDSLGNTPLDYIIDDYDLETRSLKETGNISFDMQKKYEIVDLLIKEDANINTTKNFKNEILFYTIMKITLVNIELLESSDKKNEEINSSINLFKLIVSTGVDLNSMSIEVKGKSVNLVDFSIIKIATINSTLQQQVASYGLEKIVELLLDKNMVVYELYRPVLLMYGVKLDSQKIVQAMLDNGENVNMTMGEEFPAYIAARKNSVEMLKFLESRGGYLNGVNYEGGTPLSAAVENNSLEAVNYLAKNYYYDLNQKLPDSTYLIMKAVNGSNSPKNSDGKEIVKTLLENQDINVNCEIDIPNYYFDNIYAFSPLSISTDLDILRLLINKGADVNLRSNIGSTALMNTINTKKIEFLLNNGANINAVDKENNTALTSILRSFDNEVFYLELTFLDEEIITSVAKLLIEKGIDIQVVNKSGYDAFLYSVKFNFTKLAELLIEKGTDIKRKNMNGQNALILSAKAGNYQLSKLLLDKGLKVNTVDNEGNTPLILAILSENMELAKLLIEKGADLNAKNSLGYTALDMIKSSSNLKLKSFIIESGTK